ncbi:hypothetical protein MYXO_00389 [Myxococcaceae bacterium]|nr:hypothetical protein MYXO_00389 [Myxococcaceae bacterium]
MRACRMTRSATRPKCPRGLCYREKPARLGGWNASCGRIACWKPSAVEGQKEDVGTGCTTRSSPRRLCGQPSPGSRATAAPPGVDGMTVEAFGNHLEEEIMRLRSAWKAGTYRPQSLRRVWISKPGTESHPPSGEAEESRPDQGCHPQPHATEQRRQPGGTDRPVELGPHGLVRLFPQRYSAEPRSLGQDDPASPAQHAVQASRMVDVLGARRSAKALVQGLLRRAGAVLAGAGSRTVHPCPSSGPLTGEPYAGNPPVRFGGRGGRETGHPYPHPGREKERGTGQESSRLRETPESA